MQRNRSGVAAKSTSVTMESQRCHHYLYESRRDGEVFEQFKKFAAELQVCLRGPVSKWSHSGVSSGSPRSFLVRNTVGLVSQRWERCMWQLVFHDLETPSRHQCNTAVTPLQQWRRRHDTSATPRGLRCGYVNTATIPMRHHSDFVGNMETPPRHHCETPVTLLLLWKHRHDTSATPR